MKKNTLVWTIIIIVVLIIIAIIVFQNNSATSTVSNSNSNVPMIPATPQAQGTAVLNTATNANLGMFLVATNGMTLYQYSKDSSGVSNCTGSCASAWPPYTVSAQVSPTGGTGVYGTVSTITRADGTMQVTYNGIPLYFFQSDSKPGDVTGQNVNGFSVVKP